VDQTCGRGVAANLKTEDECRTAVNEILQSYKQYPGYSDFRQLELGIENNTVELPIIVKPGEQSQLEPKLARVEDQACTQKTSGQRPIIAEEFFAGRDYRLLVLEDKVLAALERVRPAITGDGQKTVKALAHEYYQKHAPDIDIDEETVRAVNDAGHELDTILPKGEKITLRQNANTSTGALGVNVTDQVSSFFKDVAVKSLRALNLKYGGVDILTSDIAASDVDYRVIEINGDADFCGAHIKPDIGEPIDASMDIVKAMLGIK